MSKKIDLSEQGSWSDEEARFNVQYLEDRGKFADAKKIREARGFEDGPLLLGNSFTPDAMQRNTSLTGTADRPDGPTVTGGDAPVGPASPPGTASGGSGDSGSELEEGSVEWIQKKPISEVTEWVGDSDERAQYALEAEAAKGDDARTTLVKELKEQLYQ